LIVPYLNASTLIGWFSSKNWQHKRREEE